MTTSPPPHTAPAPGHASSADQPRTLIVRTAGTNCDRELVHAFELAGASATTLHLHELIEHPQRLADFDIIGFPGGFSYGDDIAAGRIFANRLRHQLYQPLRDAIERGVPIIGICNGFQVLVKLGLLPDPHANAQNATLADNTNGRFVDRWIELNAPEDTVCIWTKNAEHALGDFELPIAHGEGRFVASPDVLSQMQQQKQIALRYRNNPNGSLDDIAGICDSTGLVFGLMPHPERYVDPTQHPCWTRHDAEKLTQITPGQIIFQNAVQYAMQHRPSAAHAEPAATSAN